MLNDIKYLVNRNLHKVGAGTICRCWKCCRRSYFLYEDCSFI